MQTSKLHGSEFLNVLKNHDVIVVIDEPRLITRLDFPLLFLPEVLTKFLHFLERLPDNDKMLDFDTLYIDDDRQDNDAILVVHDQ